MWMGTNLSAFEAIFYKLQEQGKIEIGSKKTGRNFIHVDDICDGIAKAINKKGYNIFKRKNNVNKIYMINNVND